MVPGIGWYLIGPVVAVGLVAFLGAVFWRMGLQWTVAREAADGLDIFHEDCCRGGELELGEGHYGLLGAAMVTDSPVEADDIQLTLRTAGIRATRAVGPDGRTAILVFVEELEEARRLVA